MASKNARLGIDVDMATANAEREANKLQRQIEQLAKLSPTINIGADGGQAERTAEEVTAAVKAVPNNVKVTFDGSAVGVTAAAGTVRTELASIPDTKTLKFIADYQRAQADIALLTAKIEALGRLKPSPEVDMKIDKANAQLLALQVKLLELERKKVNLRVDVDSGGSIAKLTLLGTTGDSALKTVSSGATTASGMLARMGPVAGAVAAAFPLIATAAAGIPAVIGLIAVPLAAVLIGLDGIKAAAQQLAPVFGTVQAAVSAAFVTGLQPAIQSALTLMPTLTTGLSGTATALGRVASAALDFVSSGPGLQQLQQLFDGVNRIIASLAPSITTLTSNLLSMANQGIAGLSGLGKVMDDIGAAWSTAIQEMQDTGTLQAAVAALVDIFGALMRLLPSLVELGVQFMAAFGPQAAQLLNTLATVVGFLATAMSALFDITQPVRDAFATLPGPVQTVLSLFSSIIPGMGLLTSTAGTAADATNKLGTSAAGTATALSPLQTSIDNVSKAQAAYNTAVQLYGPASTQAQAAMTALQTAAAGLGTAQQTVTQAQQALNAAVLQYGPDSAQAKTAAEGLATAQKTATDATKAAEVATKALTQAQKDQLTATQSLINNSLGYKGALLNVEAAQKTMNQAIKDHGKNSLEARQATNSYEQAIASASTSAGALAKSLTEGLSPMQRTAAEATANADSLAAMASAATGPAKTALLGLADNFDDATLKAASTAVELSGVAKKVVTLPSGRTITIAADASKIPQIMAEAQKKVADTKLNTEIVPGTDQVGPALQGAQQQAQGAPMAQPVVPNVQAVPGVLTQNQADALNAAMAQPVTPNTTAVDPTLQGVVQQGATTPVNMPVTADTAQATANITALSAQMTGLVAQVAALNIQLGPAGAGFAALATSLPVVATQVGLLAPTLTTVAAQMALLATSLPTVATQMGLLGPSSTTVAAQSALLGQSLPIVAAQMALLATSLPGVATQMGLLGPSSTTVAAQFGLLAPTSTIVAAQMALLATSLPTVATQFGLLGPSSTVVAAQFALLATSLPVAATQFGLLATSLPTVATQFSALATSVPAVAAALTTLNAQLTTFVQTVTTFTTNTGTQFDQLLAKIKTTMDQSAAAVEAAGTRMSTAWQAALDAMVQGTQTGMSDVANVIQDVMNAILDYFEALYAVFEAEGTNLGISFVNGLLSQQQNAFAAGQALGQAAVQGLNAGIASGSPSKEGLDSGQNLGLSFASGIDSTFRTVQASADQLGALASTSASAQLSSMIGTGDVGVVGTIADPGNSDSGQGITVVNNNHFYVDGTELKTMARSEAKGQIARNNKNLKRGIEGQRDY